MFKYAGFKRTLLSSCVFVIKDYFLTSNIHLEGDFWSFCNYYFWCTQSSSTENLFVLMFVLLLSITWIHPMDSIYWSLETFKMVEAGKVPVGW